MLKVYLAGPIASLDLKEANGWRIEMAKHLAAAGITAYNPLRHKIQYLPQSGAVGHDTEHYTDHPLVTADAITARDRNDVVTSDLMIVNFLGYEGKPTGTAVEYGWADSASVPILTIHDSELHPMLHSLTDFHCNSLAQAVEVTRAVLLP